MSAIDPAATPGNGNSAAPEPEAPQIDWESPDNPYLKRFQDTQSAYTQGQQRLREIETDPAAYADLGRQNGWIDDGGEDLYEDPYEQELADMRAWREQVDAERAASARAQGEELFHRDLDAWAEQDGVKLSAADHNAIFGVLMRSPDPSQEAYARQAYEAHAAHKKAEREQLEAEIRESMRRPAMPTPPAAGAANTGVPNWREMSEDQINEYMAQRAASGA